MQAAWWVTQKRWSGNFIKPLHRKTHCVIVSCAMNFLCWQSGPPLPKSEAGVHLKTRGFVHDEWRRSQVHDDAVDVFVKQWNLSHHYGTVCSDYSELTTQSCMVPCTLVKRSEVHDAEEAKKRSCIIRAFPTPLPPLFSTDLPLFSWNTLLSPESFHFSAFLHHQSAFSSPSL